MKTHPVRSTTLALLALATSLGSGCSKAAAPVAEVKPVRPVVALAGAHDTAPSAPNAGAPSLTGTVLETMNAAGYTYLKLKTSEGETWAAVNEAKVEKGAVVTIASPMTMDGFESKTLNRKFEHIVFGTLAGAPSSAPAAMGGASAPSMPSGMAGVPPPPPASMPPQHPPVSSAPETNEKIAVAKAEGSEGRTIAELFAQRAALKGKTVALRGKVVKYNGGIMGKNWIHLRDGSGSAEAKNNDVTVTTNDTVAKGDVVVVKGTVAVDRDLGAGYTYVVVVEEAKVTR